MKENMGTADRVVRSFLALMVGVMLNALEFSEATAIVLASICVLLLYTSFTGVCLIYRLFNIKTIKPLRLI